MNPWEIRYGPKPTIGIYTPRPDLITDSISRWSQSHLGLSFTNIIALYSGSRTLERYISRVHDRKFDTEYEHYLYVLDPVALDLSDLYTCMDLEHTMYYDIQERFAVYRRDRVHRIKTVDLESRPKTGVIFIDCWQNYLDKQWIYQNDQHDVEQDFYQRMIHNLCQHNLHSYVFLQSEFDPQPLAQALEPWSHSPQAVWLGNINGFKKHIQSTNIQHWIVVGGHWGFCTHDKALGFFNLLSIKQQDPLLHFYSVPDSTAKFVVNNHKHSVLTTCNEQDYANDSLKWVVKNNLAELILQ